MTKGVLAIPGYIVASESAFSTGDHFLDSFGSSLKCWGTSLHSKLVKEGYAGIKLREYLNVKFLEVGKHLLIIFVRWILYLSSGIIWLSISVISICLMNSLDDGKKT